MFYSFPCCVQPLCLRQHHPVCGKHRFNRLPHVHLSRGSSTLGNTMYKKWTTGMMLPWESVRRRPGTILKVVNEVRQWMTIWLKWAHPSCVTCGFAALCDFPKARTHAENRVIMCSYAHHLLVATHSLCKYLMCMQYICIVYKTHKMIFSNLWCKYSRQMTSSQSWGSHVCPVFLKLGWKQFTLQFLS